VQYQARIIADEGAGEDAVAKAAYVGAASADYWRGAAGSFTAVGVSNEDVGIARFKALSGAWRVFTMSSNGSPAMAPPRDRALSAGGNVAHAAGEILEILGFEKSR
jgi:hypothetical protein